MNFLSSFRSLHALANSQRVLIAATGLLATACNTTEPVEPAATPDTEISSDLRGFRSRVPDRVDFVSQGLYPEGVAYDQYRNTFLVSSAAKGQVGTVSATGTYHPFAQDSALISSFGVRLDRLRRRVLVAAGDIGVSPRSTPQTTGKQALLAIYDQASGRRQALVRLSDLRPNLPHVANDVTTDFAGNAYVTDSFSGLIYKVTPAGHASVFVENAALAPTPNGVGFGLNGIVYHPDGYLIVAKFDDQKLLKISLRQPNTITEINLNGATIFPDGLLLSRDGRRLIVVNNGAGGSRGASSIAAFETQNNWTSARQVNSFATDATGPVAPTTVTVVGDDVYVLYSFLGQLLAGTQPPVATFSLQKLPFSLSGRR
ncbi:hypothetical protein [Hymenobacter terrenus]|uniref:hypothetical protein n=1 Tax=Hymenobacter terrenus TaxID=1629124 RepID=UPI00069786DF|nr:hypothetical protein [Hymenobacter terrenus]